MNNEQQQIIDRVYEKALMEYGFKSLPSTPTGTWFETIETFIHKCKIDNEFSNKWGLQIEERELSLNERVKLFSENVNGEHLMKYADSDGLDVWNEILNKHKIPTKQITITYNDKKIETYE